MCLYKEGQFDRKNMRTANLNQDDLMEEIRISINEGNIEAVKEIYLERGGGGTGEESYELAAYYFARKTELDSISQGRKGFLFFLGDEAPYSKVMARHVHQVIGDSLKDDISSKLIFDELQEKYNVFLIYPRQTMEQRLGSINGTWGT